MRGSNETDLGNFKKSETYDAGSHPYIFAVSSLIDRDIEIKAKKFGFDSCVEGPLTQEKVQKNIIDFMERDKNFKKKQNSMAFFDDVSSMNSARDTHQFEEAP